MHQEVLIRCKHAQLTAKSFDELEQELIPSCLTTVEHCNQNYICTKDNCPLQECKPEPYELNN